MKQHFKTYSGRFLGKLSYFLSCSVAHGLSRLDEKDTFRVLQPKNEAPEYYDQVKYPMCWRMIEEKLDAHEYWDPDTFKVHFTYFGLTYKLMP